MKAGAKPGIEKTGPRGCFLDLKPVPIQNAGGAV